MVFYLASQMYDAQFNARNVPDALQLSNHADGPESRPYQEYKIKRKDACERGNRRVRRRRR